jgi:predicted nucleic acid-binding protein
VIAIDQNFYPAYLDLGKILALAKEEKIKLILSVDILSEIKAVLLYPKRKKPTAARQKA